MQSSKFPPPPPLPPPPAPAKDTPPEADNLLETLSEELDCLDKVIDMGELTLKQINQLTATIQANSEYNPVQGRNLLNKYGEAIIQNSVTKDYVTKSLDLLNSLINNQYPNDPLFSSVQLPQKKKLMDEASGEGNSNSSTPNSHQVKKSKPSKTKAQLIKPQIPLVKGTRVASLPKGNEETQEWILSTVIKCFSDRNRVDVEDAEEAEEGGKKQVYSMSKTQVIPLPLRTFPPPKYAPDTEVLALYPNTTCFYKATVIKTVNDPDIPNLNECLLKFEDDEDNQHFVDGYYVLEYPKNR